MYEIAISFVSCFIVWLVWFLIAKEKHHHGHMIFSTQFCCFAFIVLAWGALCGAVCLSAYALINYIKKSFPEFPKEEKTNEHNPQQIQAPTKTEQPPQNENSTNLETTNNTSAVKPQEIELTASDETDNPAQPKSPLAIFLFILLGFVVVMGLLLVIGCSIMGFNSY